MVLGKVKAEFADVKYSRNGYEVSFYIDQKDKESLFSFLHMLHKQQEKSENRLMLNIQPYFTDAEQNRAQFLWVLLEILADARSVKAGKEITPQECFVELIESFGLQSVRILCDKKDIDRLAEIISTYAVLEESSQQIICKAFPDVTQLEPKCIRYLIDAVFDELISLGMMQNHEVQYLYQQWCH